MIVPVKAEGMDDGSRFFDPVAVQSRQSMNWKVCFKMCHVYDDFSKRRLADDLL